MPTVFSVNWAGCRITSFSPVPLPSSEEIQQLQSMVEHPKGTMFSQALNVLDNVSKFRSRSI